jgi:hypothetical protein
MNKADLLKAIDEYANTEFETINIDGLDDETWVRIAEMAHERDITFNQMVCIILEEQIEEWKKQQEEQVDDYCPVCRENFPNLIFVDECLCDVQETFEEVKEEVECTHDNTVPTAHWGNVCKDCGEYGVVSKEEVGECDGCEDCTCDRPDEEELECDIHLCRSNKPATVMVYENIDDGSWRVDICEECAELFGITKEGQDIPMNALELLRKHYGEDAS